jgi:tetratricopeptide (TPR) repeat protein
VTGSVETFTRGEQMNKEELLERYEALGDEADFAAAKPLYEDALAGGADATTLTAYGYLLECHARRELRRAAELYEQAVELDPDDDKPNYHLISALAALQDADVAVARYEGRLAAARGEVREHRFLATALLKQHDYAGALDVAVAGLELTPDDYVLLGLRGEARAGLGEVEAALADWRRALELEPEDIGALFSTAFLLEREGRVAEAIAAWQAIVEWNDVRGYAVQTEWPRQMLERLQRGGA